MSTKEIKKITEEDIRKEVARLKKLSSDEKDAALATLMVAVDRIVDILKVVVIEIHDNKKKSLSEVQEIEDILNLGPEWLRYSRRVKRRKVEPKKEK